LVDQSVVEQPKLHLVPPIWHNLAMETVNLLRAHYKDFTKENLYTIATLENILIQIDHLLTYPFIQNKIKAKKLWIHGWLQIDNEEKTLFNYGFSSKNFMILEQDMFNKDGKLTYLPKRY
jgi:carbonic anhydrase